MKRSLRRTGRSGTTKLSTRRPQGRSPYPITTLTAAICVIAAALMLTACGASVHVGFGGATLNAPEHLVSKALEKVAGSRPPSVDCPSSIPAKSGHVFHCRVVINAKGDYVIATVTESTVSGSNAHLQISDSKKVYKP